MLSGVWFLKHGVELTVFVAFLSSNNNNNNNNNNNDNNIDSFIACLT